MTNFTMNRRVHIDTFSGAAADLRGLMRTSEYVLRALAHDPRASTWDMDTHVWLRGAIEKLKRLGLIEEVPATYPWHVYRLTAAGTDQLKATP